MNVDGGLVERAPLFIERSLVNLSVYIRMGQQGLYLGSKDIFVPILIVIKRLDAKVIAGKQ